jgi:hypothetical protein
LSFLKGDKQGQNRDTSASKRTATEKPSVSVLLQCCGVQDIFETSLDSSYIAGELGRLSGQTTIRAFHGLPA